MRDGHVKAEKQIAKKYTNIPCTQCARSQKAEENVKTPKTSPAAAGPECRVGEAR